MATNLPRRILVTGAGGFVGRHLVAALGACVPPPEIIAAGRVTGSGVSVALDLTDATAVDVLMARDKPDAVVHLAGQASVGAAESGAVARTFAVNVGGTRNLAVAIARHAADMTVLFISSSEIYGRAFGSVPLDEDAVPRPANAYARSKLMAEVVLAAVLPETMRLVIARPFNHTGPGQREAFVLASFAGQIARIEARRQAPVLRVGNLGAHRDFLDVRDVVAAYVAILAAAPDLPPRFVCNVATGTALPLRDLLEALRRLARVPFTVEIDPARLRPSEIPYAAGTAARLADATGWAPRVPLHETLATLLDDARRRVVAGATSS